MQAILATRIEDHLEEITDQADRIYEIEAKAVAATIPSIPHVPLQPQPSTSQAVEETQIMMLIKQMAAMTKLTKEWSQKKARNQARSRSKNQQRFWPRSKTPRRNGVYYYHRRFGQKKYTQPCTFKKENE